MPYRKWPRGAEIFHEMICLARPIKAKEAAVMGMVRRVVKDYPELIQAAVEEVKSLVGNVKGTPDGKVDIPEFQLPEEPKAGGLALSKEAVSIIVKTIEAGAAAATFEEALEIGYQGNAEIACTEAAKEGISAFLEKRKPVFNK